MRLDNNLIACAEMGKGRRWFGRHGNEQLVLAAHPLSCSICHSVVDGLSSISRAGKFICPQEHELNQGAFYCQTVVVAALERVGN